MPRITVYPKKVTRSKVPDELFGTNIEWTNPVTSVGPPVTLARFPGGVFSDTYHWQTPIGEVVKVYPSAPAPYNEIAVPHNFNTDSLLALGIPALITVNCLSTAEEAAAWVAKYPQIKYWEIGNEVYNPKDWAGHLTVDEYIAVLRKFIPAMRAANPGIQILGIGDDPRWGIGNDPNWIKRVANETNIDHISLHTYNMTNPDYINAVKAVIPKGINIALTEWGPLHSLTTSSVDTMGAAFEVADSMMIFMSENRVKIATFFKLKGDSVVGWYDENNKPQPTLMSLLLFYLMDRKLVRVDSPGIPALAGPKSLLMLNKTANPTKITVRGITLNNYVSLLAPSLSSKEISMIEHDGKVLPPYSITLGRYV